MCRDATHQPVAAKTLALELAADTWQQIKWRDGSDTPLTSRFARWRVRPAHDDARRSEPAAEEWLLTEWPQDAAEQDHYWLCTLPAHISLERMVDQAKLRWRIERDYPNSNKRSASAITKVEAGVVSIITQFFVSQPTDSWCPRRRRFAPQGRPAPGEARNLPFPTVIDPEDRPLRSQRHMPNSIAIAYPPRADFGARTASMCLLRTAASKRRRAD